MMSKFSSQILRWYQKNKRNLPWRETKDPYKIWISEIMLQQTTVNAVIPYYKGWIKQFPKIESIARARQQTILKAWQGLGYYNRAKNLHNAAKLIVNDHNKQIPQEPDVLRKLPGFGPYTTGAVLSIAFDQKETIIDANVRRFIMRLLAIEGLPDATKDEKVETFLKKNLPNKNMGDFNQGLMEIGALVCMSKSPTCLICPVKDFCKAYAKGIQELIPQTKKKTIKELDVAIGILRDKDRYYLQKRASKGLLADLWEFPGGKIERGESAKIALKRELKEEVGVQVRDAEHLLNVTHFYTEFKVKLHVFLCQADKLPIQSSTRKWLKLNDLKKYPLPSGSARIVDHLFNNFKALKKA